jgi:sarcosine oxidase
VPEDREFAVVGAGLLGLATARALARRGRDVVVFEQAAAGHPGGGSHGSARIFRLGYPDPGYVAMAARARELWRDLEAEAGRQLLVPAGQLTSGDRLGDLRAAMLAAGAACELLPAAEAAARFPAIVAGGPCLLEPQSAVIAADQVLLALAATVPDLRAGRRVSQVVPERGRVIIRAGDTVVRARSAIVCAGPWTARILARAGVIVPATATLEQVAYVAPAAGQSGTAAGPAGERAASLPIFIRHGPVAPYGLPVPGQNLYKIGLHASVPGLSGPVVRPGDHEISTGEPGEDPRLRAGLIEAARRHLPGYEPSPVTSERCVYDHSPDGDFIVDRAGPIVVGSGTSGHGFKFGPLLGEWLADLATGRNTDRVPARFSLARFGGRAQAGPPQGGSADQPSR